MDNVKSSIDQYLSFLKNEIKVSIEEHGKNAFQKFVLRNLPFDTFQPL